MAIRKIQFPDMTEDLEVTSLGQGLYRLEETSMSEVGVFFHDVIFAKRRLLGALEFVRAEERSGLRVFSFILSWEVSGSEALQEFLKRVVDHGGHWEKSFGGFLMVHLPRGSACRPKSELRALQASMAATIEMQAPSSGKATTLRLDDMR